MKRVKRIAVAAAGLFIYCCAAAVAAPRAKAYETGAYTAECGADVVAAVAVLRKGSKGDEVKEVQRRLKRWGYYSGSVDGIFGAGTRAAVIAFQKKNGLTADGVVYQKGAFTAVSDGQINLSPDSAAMSAAQDAVNGWDPTGGAIYYYNPAVATSSWIFSRKTVTVIGKHVFAV